ncbi:MAG: acylphosphatase [Thermodesulfobacteriota bacterium]|nr:acylphosphatase [Desulfovibrionales bacterium]MDQ7838334.1 acylphosphatase [Thermodesulfobacteriota bacterium]
MPMVRAHVIINGRVQGVFFRYATQEEATRLGLKGWVKNRRDGQVEAVFEGDEATVEKMLKWCHQGPPHAVVNKVDVNWEDYKGESDRFDIRY